MLLKMSGDLTLGVVSAWSTAPKHLKRKVFPGLAHFLLASMRSFKGVRGPSHQGEHRSFWGVAAVAYSALRYRLERTTVGTCGTCH